MAEQRVGPRVTGCFSTLALDDKAVISGGISPIF